MRILRISLLCLTLSSFVTFSFADSDDATEKAQENETDVYYIDTGFGGRHLTGLRNSFLPTRKAHALSLRMLQKPYSQDISSQKNGCHSTSA